MTRRVWLLPWLVLLFVFGFLFSYGAVKLIQGTMTLAAWIVVGLLVWIVASMVVGVLLGHWMRDDG